MALWAAWSLTAVAVACIVAGTAFPQDKSIWDCKEPTTTVDSGALRGICRPAKLGRPRYAAFLGIPFAKPPLRNLRFKGFSEDFTPETLGILKDLPLRDLEWSKSHQQIAAGFSQSPSHSPRPVEPWSGMWDALTVSSRCLQGEVDKHTGSEDCLYLNVYSPRLEYNTTLELLPVLVHVHGGGMTVGSGTNIRPDYFVAQNIVVVTFNYRLSRFGFLNMDTDEAPGNAGLKDVIAALKWINRNIHSFGGDSEKVTVNGCSAGAILVHWACLLPGTEGLFRAAIIKSGSALVSWGYTEYHQELATAALQFLEKWEPGKDTNDLLHNSSALLLDIAFAYAEKHRVATLPENYNVPTVAIERRSAGVEPKLIERDPESYILRPVRSSVPMMIGITSCELDPMGDRYFMMGELPPTIIRRMVPRSLIPQQDARTDLGLESCGLTYDDAVVDLRGSLFNLSAIDPGCNMVCRWERYFSDTYMSVDTARAMRMHARRAPDKPVYAFISEFPIDSVCGTGGSNSGGTLHAHDDKLVWPEDDYLVHAFNTSDPLSLTILRQVTAFGNFVKFGNPVPKKDPFILTTEWQPMGVRGPDVFMRFNANWTMDSGDILGRFGPMWKELYDKYRCGKGI